MLKYQRLPVNLNTSGWGWGHTYTLSSPCFGLGMVTRLSPTSAAEVRLTWVTFSRSSDGVAHVHVCLCLRSRLDAVITITPTSGARLTSVTFGKNTEVGQLVWFAFVACVWFESYLSWGHFVLLALDTFEYHVGVLLYLSVFSDGYTLTIMWLYYTCLSFLVDTCEYCVSVLIYLSVFSHEYLWISVCSSTCLSFSPGYLWISCECTSVPVSLFSYSLSHEMRFSHQVQEEREI